MKKISTDSTTTVAVVDVIILKIPQSTPLAATGQLKLENGHRHADRSFTIDNRFNN